MDLLVPSAIFRMISEKLSERLDLFHLFLLRTDWSVPNFQGLEGDIPELS